VLADRLRLPKRPGAGADFKKSPRIFNRANSTGDWGQFAFKTLHVETSIHL
jgi:hypothetical protein